MKKSQYERVWLVSWIIFFSAVIILLFVYVYFQSYETARKLWEYECEREKEGNK